MCTAQLEQRVIEVIDQHENPLSGIQFEIVNVCTGKHLCETAESDRQKSSCLQDLGEIGPGIYSIVTSLNTDSVMDVKEREILIVSGRYGDIVFLRKYMIRLDSSRCHPRGGIEERIIMNIN